MSVWNFLKMLHCTQKTNARYLIISGTIGDCEKYTWLPKHGGSQLKFARQLWNFFRCCGHFFVLYQVVLLQYIIIDTYRIEGYHMAPPPVPTSMQILIHLSRCLEKALQREETAWRNSKKSLFIASTSLASHYNFRAASESLVHLYQWRRE